MTVFDTTRLNTTSPRFGGFFTALLGALATWNDVRVTRKSLSALTDRELNDIGLCRGDIELIAHR